MKNKAYDNIFKVIQTEIVVGQEEENFETSLVFTDYIEMEVVLYPFHTRKEESLWLGEVFGKFTTADGRDIYCGMDFSCERVQDPVRFSTNPDFFFDFSELMNLESFKIHAIGYEDITNYQFLTLKDIEKELGERITIVERPRLEINDKMIFENLQLSISQLDLEFSSFSRLESSEVSFKEFFKFNIKEYYKTADADNFYGQDAHGRQIFIVIPRPQKIITILIIDGQSEYEYNFEPTERVVYCGTGQTPTIEFSSQYPYIEFVQNQRVKEMTLFEIEQALGYKIRLVEEEEDE